MANDSVLIDGAQEIYVPTMGDVLVDDDDLPILNLRGWYVRPYYLRSIHYVARSVRHPLHPGKRTLELLHRVIAGRSHGDRLIVDHRNGNGLDCRRSNLRSCSPVQNSQNMRMSTRNTSGFKGVHFDRGKWSATIRDNKATIHLGKFASAAEAHAAYCAAAIKYHGEFANFG